MHKQLITVTAVLVLALSFVAQANAETFGGMTAAQWRAEAYQHEPEAVSVPTPTDTNVETFTPNADMDAMSFFTTMRPDCLSLWLWDDTVDGTGGWRYKLPVLTDVVRINELQALTAGVTYYVFCPVDDGQPHSYDGPYPSATHTPLFIQE